MKKIILFLVLVILISGCAEKGDFGKRPGGPIGGPASGEETPPDFACDSDSDCIIDDCHGCISKNSKLTGPCLPNKPNECKCKDNICKPEPPKTEGINEPPVGEPQGQGLEQEFGFPLINKDLPLPETPAKSPKGELIKKQLGDVEISYFSTAIIRGMMESGLDYFITLKNKGASEATVYATPDDELVKQTPQWNLHFYSFQDYPVKIAPGAEKKLWYFASLDKGDGEPFTVNFKLWSESNPDKVELPVLFGSVEDDLRGKETSMIYGYVKDDTGKPVKNARVDAMINCGRSGFRGDTDEMGRYVISVLGMEDINAIYNRETACDSNDYSISIIAEGYEYYFKDRIKPTREEFVRLDIELETKKESASYNLKWEKKVDDFYGFFWVKASKDFTLFAADQAKHPPELGKPTNFYLFDSEGKVLWKQPTGNECWGIDIAADGSKVVAGCHDHKVYTVDKNGKLLWSFDTGGMVRSACFSRDGKKALSGAIQKLYLFNSENGAKQEVPWIDEWFRNCQFYMDDTGFIVGARTLAGFDSNTNKKWAYIMGEFPMFLGVDKNKNVFAAGKSRTLFSFDANGKLRWKHRIPDHVVGAGAVTPDGSRIILGTVGGMMYMFDNEGNLLWKRPMLGVGEEGGMGHNAITISLDGKRIIIGGAPNNCVLVYNEKGTLLWQGCSAIEKTSNDLLVGINSVQISEDKTKIVAAYGDNYVREFIQS
ncbi:MAG: PQQ-binding-like beta-propeller repeat protein [Nanoarchaeota archaeon]|nr:PQQ-binding-like beta-propeller repeat protein [Nanoarchaeota archaeon]